MPIPLSVIGGAHTVVAAPLFRDIDVGTPVSNVTLTFTVNKPPLLQVGDMMVAFIKKSSSDTLNGVPSGWTPVTGSTSGWTNGATTNGDHVYWKIATAGDVAAASWNWTKAGTTTGWRIDTIAYSGCSAIESANTSTGSLSTTITWAAVTTTSALTTLLFWVTSVNATAKTFSNPCPNSGTVSTVRDLNNTATNSLRGSLSEAPGPVAAGSTGTPSGTSSASQASQPILIVLKAA